jgi:hypothetical protein
MLADFLSDLLHGTVVFRAPPIPSAAEHPAALEVLRQGFTTHALDIAGPPLDFHAGAALAAAELVRQACWFLVHRDEPPAEAEQRITLPPPGTPTEHLSADVTLRFLPQVHRRARALAAADALTVRLETLLRQWPLAGVLSDVAEAPLTPPDFGGHPGLLMLYAERLAQKEKAGWMPEGIGRQYVELVFHERGKDRSALLHASD